MAPKIGQNPDPQHCLPDTVVPLLKMTAERVQPTVSLVLHLSLTLIVLGGRQVEPCKS